MSIFVIDAHPLMREAVAGLIRRVNPKASVIGLSALDALPSSTELERPEMICLELKTPDSYGIEGIKQLKTQFPDVPVVVLSSCYECRDQSIGAGADAFLNKSAEHAEIANVLRSFLLDDADADSEVGQPVKKLSKRQKQLLILLDKGMSNRDIAENLEISEHTVKVHLWRLFRRLNVKSRSQASHLARVQGLF